MVSWFCGETGGEEMELELSASPSPFAILLSKPGGMLGEVVDRKESAPRRRQDIASRHQPRERMQSGRREFGGVELIKRLGAC